MKHRSGLQEDDDDDKEGDNSIRLPSTGHKSSTEASTKIPNVGEETSTTTEMKVVTAKSNVGILVDINDNSYCNNEKELSATEQCQKINQENVLRGISFRENENEENSNASYASISDRPGAFAVQGPRYNVYNTTEDGTVQYSTAEEVETATQTQEEEQEGGKPIINDPLEAERVLETVQGTSITLNQNDSTRTKWKQLTIILGIFVFMLFAVAAVLIAFFVKSNKSSNKSLSPATVASPSPTDLPTFVPSMIPSAAPTSVQEQIVILLLEYFPDLPASNNQQQALDWIFTDHLSLGVITKEGMTSKNKKRFLLERFVLATVYFATNGIGWQNHNKWLSPMFVCEWFGIQCPLDATLEQREVNELHLNYNDLSGTIPTELGLMTSMTRLYLSRNALSGSIPTELGLMTSMTYLSLFLNDLSGSIPTELGLMTKMEYLFFDNNSLIRSIPTEVGLLTRLTGLGLSSIPYLTGTIPSEVVAILPNLQGCYMGGTELVDVPEKCQGFSLRLWA